MTLYTFICSLEPTHIMLIECSYICHIIYLVRYTRFFFDKFTNFKLSITICFPLDPVVTVFVFNLQTALPFVNSLFGSQIHVKFNLWNRNRSEIKGVGIAKLKISNLDDQIKKNVWETVTDAWETIVKSVTTQNSISWPAHELEHPSPTSLLTTLDKL